MTYYAKGSTLQDEVLLLERTFMQNIDQARTNMAAVVAIQGLLGVSEEEATDIVETVRPHLERPFVLALKDANAEISRLKK